MGSNRITILATIGAFVLGAVGANALADDGPSFGDLEAGRAMKILVDVGGKA